MRIGSIVDLSLGNGFSGTSYSDGFIVTKGEETVKSKNCDASDKKHELKLKKKHFIAWGIVWLFWLFWLFSAFPRQNANSLPQSLVILISAVVLTGFSSLILTLILFYPELYGRNVLEYHACEHKAISLLGDKRLAPTLENLKKMPRLALVCGSTKLAIMGILPLIVGITNTVAYFLSAGGHQPIVIIAIIFLIGLSLSLIIPILLQFFFTTREPSQEKLEEALEVAKEFYNK